MSTLMKIFFVQQTETFANKITLTR